MVLIIDKSKNQRISLCEMFHYMGILSYHASPNEAFSEINTKYRAILISDSESIPDINDYITRLRKYCANIPIFALDSKSKSPSYTLSADIVFDNDIYSSTLVNKIIDYQEKRMLPSLGKYLLAGLDLGCDIPKPRYLSHPINFTKTETMIIRYLTVTYPDYVSAEDILRHSLKPGKIAEPSVIRAHISSINKKFKELRDRPLVISDPGKGYVILTPELNERTKVINNT